MSSSLSVGMAMALASSLLFSGCGGPRPVTERDGANQVIAEGSKDSKKQVGDWRYFYGDGTLKAAGAWADDLQTGPWTGYHSNGQVKYAGVYINGLRTGMWTYQHATGAIKAIGSHRDDRQVGPWFLGNADDQRLAHGFFNEAGVQEGLWIWFNPETGAMDRFGLYYEGAPIGPWWHSGQHVSYALPAGAQETYRSWHDDIQSWSVTTAGVTSKVWWRDNELLAYVVSNDQGLLQSYIRSSDKNVTWISQANGAEPGVAIRLEPGKNLRRFALGQSGELNSDFQKVLEKAQELGKQATQKPAQPAQSTKPTDVTPSSPQDASPPPAATPIEPATTIKEAEIISPIVVRPGLWSL
jgi:hypothetical protein